jgi:hypothetical protein
VTLCDLTVPEGDDKTEKIESGNIDGMPGQGGWQALVRRVTVTAEVDLAKVLDLKFQTFV